MYRTKQEETGECRGEGWEEVGGGRIRGMIKDKYQSSPSVTSEVQHQTEMSTLQHNTLQLITHTDTHTLIHSGLSGGMKRLGSQSLA